MNQINWRKAEEHPRTFETGETMLVAARRDITEWVVRLKEETSKWVVDVIKADDDGDEFGYWRCDGKVWNWQWRHVVFWVPIAEVEATLPKPTEENL